MLSKAKTLTGYSLQNIDGETMGKVKDFYFDDQYWTIRYLVADTGNWLTGRHVLISPYALIAVNYDRENIVADLTKKQVQDSPSWDSDKPVSRQFEESYHGYYGYPMYWEGPYSWGTYPFIVRLHSNRKEYNQGGKAWDARLRSTRGVSGYHLQAMDGEIGHVEDFVIDDETWAIRYLIIDTKNWWSGKKILVSPQWIERVSWSESSVLVNLSQEAIKQSPEYAEESLPTRDYEIELHSYYNRHGYWDDELVVKETTH
jgi:sporulation protein YlmC with PRC-barrel domain